MRAGDVLLRIDDADYRAALAEARAAVAAAEAEIATLDAQTALEQATVEQRAADVAAAEAALTLARQDRERYDRLARTSAGTVQRAQQADYALQDRQAALAKGRAALNAAERQVEATEARRGQAAAGLERARAALTRAGLALSWTVVTAPVDGVVGDRGARVGEVVQPGTHLMQVVPTGRALYVVANLKETQLERVAAGESVSVAVDGFPHHTFRGRVDSLAPGSGAEFAILPPENATGNFTKIVQRVPVKIVLDPDDPLLGRLRPGLSVEASIDTRTGPAAGGREGTG